MGALLQSRKDVPQNPFQLKHPGEAKQGKFVGVQEFKEFKEFEEFEEENESTDGLVVFVGNIIERRAITR